MNDYLLIFVNSVVSLEWCKILYVESTQCAAIQAIDNKTKNTHIDYMNEHLLNLVEMCRCQ